MKLNELLKSIDYISCNAKSDIEISEITNNSKTLKPGDIFVCIKGYKTDGHNYAKNAEKSGASCVIASEPLNGINIPVIYVKNTRLALAQASKVIFGNPSGKLKVIGVTGTNGKTTTCYLIKSILEAAGETVGLIGTAETIVGSTRVPAMRTTPEAHELGKLFSDMLRMGATYCVMEVSSHSLELYRVHGIEFVAGVFTNLTHDHLDFHGTMENYFAAKAKLFDMCDISIVHTDDDWGKKLAEKQHKKLITYSISSPSDYRAENIIYNPDSVEFDLGGKQYRLGIPGRFSVYNALAAICTCKALSVDDEKIRLGLAGTSGAKGRCEVLKTPSDFKVIIDYAHTPDGLYNILDTLKKFAPGRIICVFGAAGERDAIKRPEMGEVVGKYADIAYITADNPINEDLTVICSQVESGIKKTGCKYHIIYDRKEAIISALNAAKKNDTLLLAGKGHETYQLIGDEKVPFSEAGIVKEYFKNRGNSLE